ncbi:MAG: ligase-associated DNA damage response endonuclease PdeM [Alphaproteobacteria bacterium]
MAMLSDANRKPKPRVAAPARRARLPLEASGDSVSLRIAGLRVTALPEGALWLSEREALVVSDLHLEKGTAYARSGHRLPPYDTRSTLQRLAALMASLKPRMVITLGDTFHDRGAMARLDLNDRNLLTAMVDFTDWVWIEGNHDPEPPYGLGGRCESEVSVLGLTFRHLPAQGEAAGEISGHLHPCARVASRSGSVRRRCFATDGARVVMPAFGAYAGGLNVCDEAFAPLFPTGCHALMLGRSRVFPAGPGSLVGD